MKKSFTTFFIIITLLIAFAPRLVFASGIGFRDFDGDVTITNSSIRNNLYGIQATTTNASTIQNLWIFSNTINDSDQNGISIDSFDATGGVTIRNNYLDNSNIPSTAPRTKNGRFGIRVINSPNPSIANNSIQNFGRSGIQLQSVANITIINNYLYSNGSQKYYDGDLHKASGIQAKDSTFVNITDNIIVSNYFSGIAAYSTGGTIDNNNIIKFNGGRNLSEDNGSGVTGGACLAAAGEINGGILVRDLQAGEVLEVCDNTIGSNRSNNLAKIGADGDVTRCGTILNQNTFFASSSDAVFFFDNKVDTLDCAFPTGAQTAIYDIQNSTINAATGNKKFGVLITGDGSDVTIKNCTIKNAAMNTNNRASANDQGTIRYIGAGIFVGNNATSWIANNYLFSNGWGLLNDELYTNAGASGIQMRCANPNTSIINNVIASNLNDGIVARDTGGFIGVAGEGNTFRNNGRSGLGIYDGTASNLNVWGNTILNNQRGIGVFTFDGSLLNIARNYIHSNSIANNILITSSAGIAIKDLAASVPVTIENNTIVNNSGNKVGGIGLSNASLTTVDLGIFSNTISNNTRSGIGIDSAQAFTIRNNIIFSNSAPATSVMEYYSFGIKVRDSAFTDDSIVSNIIHSNKFAGIGADNTGGTIGPNNNIRFNGVTGAGSNLCASLGGTGRGGISAKGLVTGNLYVEASNIVTQNYDENYQSGAGNSDTFFDKYDESVSNAFWDSGDVGLEITESTLINGQVFSNANVWGISIIGDSQVKVTLNNITIKNNGLSEMNGPGGKVGGGILVAGGASLSMSNSSVYNNGLSAQVESNGGSGGVVIRCSSSDTILHNNFIVSNANDGISLYDSDGVIGLSGKENTIRNNGRNGIGLSSYAGADPRVGPTIAYNAIYSNTTFGIGSWGLTNMNATISYNTIYSNHVTNSLGIGGKNIGGGIGFAKLMSLVLIENNTIRNNTGNSTGGIGIIDTSASGTVSIMNNKIFGNSTTSTGAGGIGLRDVDAAAIVRVQGNSIYNNDGFRASGIGITNSNATTLNVAIYSNEIFQNKKAGLGVWSASSFEIKNNRIFSNGWSGTVSGGEVYGAGIQLRNASFNTGDITGNSISSNWFAGIAANATTGYIGANNEIFSNGVSGGGSGGGLEDCMVAAGSAGDIRGGVLVKGLSGAQEFRVMCGANVHDNLDRDVAMTDGGKVFSCSNSVTSFFASSSDTIFYFDESSESMTPGFNTLDCANPTAEQNAIYAIGGDSIINAVGKKFGIIVVGAASKATIKNCTIKNAAMNESTRATVTNGTETRYLGAGIFITNNATPSIANNYIFSNGWALLDDRLYTSEGSAGSSGIQMRCAENATSIVNNVIASNANDGLVMRESGGVIGAVGAANTFRNNGRGGIGIMDGTTRNLDIAYNTINNNQRGIGAIDFDGTLLDIHDNYIYANSIVNDNIFTSAAGVLIKNLASAATTEVSISNNTIESNSGYKVGGIGLRNPSMVNVDFTVLSNSISNNQQSGIGIMGADGFTIKNNWIIGNGKADYQMGDEYHSFGVQIRDSVFQVDSFIDNVINSSWFAGIGANDCGGTIGNSATDNSIQFNGLGVGGGGACAGVGGSGRGGISARDIKNNGVLVVIDDNYVVTNNTPMQIQKNPNSTNDFYYRGAAQDSTYWAGTDVGTVINQNGTVLDCDIISTNEFAGNNVWGITVVGDIYATIQNCTIQNNCASGACNLTVNNQPIGGGVLIAGGAKVLMDGNYIHDNGRGANNISFGGYAGVAMRCAGSETQLVNNIIASNANDGIAAYDTNGSIGLSAGQRNTIRNNGRNGIGLNSFDQGSNSGPEIAYNLIYTNAAFGIGAYNLTNMNASIYNNIIFSNHTQGANSFGAGGDDIGGGIGIINLQAPNMALIDENTIRNNTGAKGGGIGVSASNGTYSFTNNLVMNNISSAVGGIGFNDLTDAFVYLEGNIIDSNMGDKVGGIGVTLTNGATDLSFINNQIQDNVGSSWDSALNNVGGMGFRALASTSFVYIDQNTLVNNRAYSSVSTTEKRVGAVGFSASNADISFVNNRVGLNKGSCIGGVGFDTYDVGTVVVDGNEFFDNKNSKSSLGAGGLAFDFVSGTISVTNNKVFHNTNTATGSGGIGFNFLQAGASVWMAQNSVYNNIGLRAAGIGITNSNTSDITVYSNWIYNNDQAGMGIFNVDYVTIQNNFIVSNGKADTKLGDDFFASGIQLRDVTVAASIINGNIIRNNEFAGIAVHDSSGTIGPNNTIMGNGQIGGGSNSACAGVGGNGRGGVSVRELVADNLVILNDSDIFTDNNIKDIQLKPGSTKKLYFIENDNPAQEIAGTLLDQGDVAWYIDGTNTFINGQTIEDGNVWGVAAVGPYNVTIVNSTIINNCTSEAACNLVGKQGHRIGGGILIAGGATLSMSNTTVINNGYAAQNFQEGGISGVAIRCSDGNYTSIHNNWILSNANDGIDLFDSAAVIGFSGGENTIRNNGRHGIGMSSFDQGASDGPVISYNYIADNKSLGVGAWNLTNMNATITNNIIASNHSDGSTNIFGPGSADLGGGVGLMEFASEVSVVVNSNTLRYNVGSGSGSIGVSAANGTLVVNYNEIYNNSVVNGSTGVGGIGLSDMGVTASAEVKGNTVYNNQGDKVAGIGVEKSNTSNISIIANSVYDNYQSGIGVSLSNNVKILDNYIASNGSGGGAAYQRAGLQLTYSTFAMGEVANNIIRNNEKIGIAVFNVDGSIGPNNVVKLNGQDSGGGGSCPGLTGSGGDGGLAVKGLDISDTLIFSKNVISDNFSATITRADCPGDVYHNSTIFNCTGAFTSDDVGVYVDTTNAIIDCTADSTPGDPLDFDGSSLDGNRLWGIAVMGGAKNVTIRNCSIANNMTVNNTAGGGILVGPNAEAFIHDNTIDYNGDAGTTLAEGEGGIAGVVLRCADPDTNIWNNNINNNVYDGVTVKYSAGTVGNIVLGLGNTIQLNNRNGIGVANGDAADSAYIANNVVDNNSGRGIGVVGDANVTILNNEIMNHTSAQGQGLGFGGGSVTNGSAGAAGANTVALDAGSSGIAGAYNGMLLLSDGDPAYAMITDYDKDTKTVTISQNWVGNPSTYTIYQAAMARAFAKDNDIHNNKQGLGIMYAAPTSYIHVFSNNIYANTNGSGPGGVGVISGLNGAMVSVENNIIDGNTGASGNPGGVGITNSNGMIKFTGNTITNSGGSGLGIENILSAGVVLVESGLISGNQATGDQIGGVEIRNIHHGGFVTVDNNTISFNDSTGADTRTMGVGIKFDPVSYTGQYGYVKVSNNSLHNNTSMSDPVGIGVKGVSVASADQMDLSGELSSVVIDGNVLESATGTGNSAMIGVWWTKGGNVIIERNSIPGPIMPQAVAIGGDAFGTATEPLSILIRHNKRIDGGVKFGGDETSGTGEYLNKYHFIGTELLTCPNGLGYAGGKLPMPYEFHKFCRPCAPGNANCATPAGPHNIRPTWIVSGNFMEDHEQVSFVLVDQQYWSSAADALDLQMDSNVYSYFNSGIVTYRGGGKVANMYARGNRSHATCLDGARGSSGGGLMTSCGAFSIRSFNHQWAYFLQNKLFDVGGAGAYGSGIGTGTSKSEGITIDDTMYIVNNEIWSTVAGGINFETGGGTGGGVVIEGNRISDTDTGGGGYSAIGLAVGADYSVNNNILFNNPNAGVYANDSAATVVALYNTSYGNDYGLNNNASSSFTGIGNIAYENSSGDFSGLDSNSLFLEGSDPGNIFVNNSDPSQDNYLHLASSAIAAIDVGGTEVTQDFDGAIRDGSADLGADEYNTNNSIPVVSIVNASQSTNGDNTFTITYQAIDTDAVAGRGYFVHPRPLNSETSYWNFTGSQYSIDAGANWYAIEDMTIGTFTFDSSSGTDRTFDWPILEYVPGVETAQAWVRLQASDWYDYSDINNADSTFSNFTIDTIPPRNLDYLRATNATSSSITLGWTEVEDGNFDRYEIWYTSTLGPVVPGCGSCSSVTINNKTTTSTVIGSLDGTYSFNIFAYDTVGHETAAYAESTNLSTSSGGGGGSINYVMVSDTNQVPEGNVVRDNSHSGIYAFKLYTGAGSIIVDTINLSLANAVDGTDVSDATLRYDNGVLGVYDGPGIDSPVPAGTLTWDGSDYYYHNDLNETIDLDGKNFIVTLNIISTATAPSVKLILEDSEAGNPGIKEETGQTDVDVQSFINTDFEGNLRYLVTKDTVTLDTASQPASGNVTVGNNEISVYAFNLSTPGDATMENVNLLLTGTAEYGTNISGVSLYRDEGSLPQVWDDTDVLVANLSYISGYLKNTATMAEPIDSGGVDYIVTVDVAGGDGQIINLTLEASSAVPGPNDGIGLEWPDEITFAQTPGNNFTIVPGAGPSNPPVLANPSSGTSAQRIGTGLVDAFYSGLDPNFGAVDYVVASCQYSLTNGGSWTQASNGGTSWEYFTSTAEDFSFIWKASDDVTDENNSAYVRIEVKDADDNYSGTWTTQSAIAIDTKAPAAPGILINNGLTPNSVDIIWTQSGGDAGGNWLRYEINHRPCDGCALDNNQSNGEILNTVDSLVTTTTTVGGLSPNTTYTMNIWAADSFNNVAIAGAALTFTTLEAADTVTVSDYNTTLQEPLLVEKGQKYAMFGFTLVSSPGTASLDNVTVHLDPASDRNDIASVSLYENNGTDNRVHDGSDTFVDTMGWDGVDAYTLDNAAINYEIGTSDTNFIMAVTPALGATDNNMLQFAFNADSDVTAVSPDGVAAINPKFSGSQYTINKDTLTASRHFLNPPPELKVQRGLTYAMFGVNLKSSPGESSLKNMTIHFSGDNRATNIASVTLYNDNGTSGGAYDGDDDTLANMDWDGTDAYTISNFIGDPAVSYGINGENLIVGVKLTGSAGEGDKLNFSINNASDVSVETPDLMGAVATYSTGPFTVYIPLDTITVEDNTGTLDEPTAVDKLQSYAMLGIKLTSVLGTADLEDMRIYPYSGSTAVDGVDIESVMLCADDGDTPGQFDENGTDATIGNMTWNSGGGYYELNPVDPNYPIDIAGSELIVVAEVAQTAGDGKTLQFELKNLAGTDIKLNSAGDTINPYAAFTTATAYTINSDTVDVVGYNTLYGPSTVINKTASAAMFGFNLTSSPGTATLDDVRIYFEASSTGDQTDIDNANVLLCVDNSPADGLYSPGTDATVGNMTWLTDHYEMITKPTTSTIAASPGTNYIMVATIDSTATENNELRFEFRADDYVNADGADAVNSFGIITGNETFKVGGDMVTVSSYDTDNLSTNVDKVTDQTAMFGFTLTSAPSTATLNDVNIYLNSGSQGDIFSVELFEDSDTIGRYDGSEFSVGVMDWVTDHYEMLATPTSSTIATTGTDYIMVVTVVSNATDNAPLSFKFNTAGDVTAVSPDAVTPISPWAGNEEFYINGDTVTVGTYNTTYGPGATLVNKVSAQTAMFGFSLASSTGGATLNDVNIYLNSGSQTDILSVELFEDDGIGIGTYEGGEISVGTMTWITDHYEMLTKPTTSTFTTTGKDYIMVVTVDTDATDNAPLRFEFSTAGDVTVDGLYDSVDPITPIPSIGNETFYVGGDTVNVIRHDTSNVSTVVDKVSDQTAMFGFTLSTPTGSADLNNVYVYFDTLTNTATQADISAVELFVDDDSNGIYEPGTDTTSVSTMVWNTDHYELSANPSTPISTTDTDFIMVVTLDAYAADGNTVKFMIKDDDFVAVDSLDDSVTLTSFTGNEDFTCSMDSVDVTEYATANTSTMANVNSTMAMFGFTAASSPGGASLDNVNISFTQGTDADVFSVELFEDDDNNGLYDGTEPSVDTMDWNGTDAYTLTNGTANYPISIGSGTNFIMVVTVDGDATVDNKLEFEISQKATDLTLTGGSDMVSGSGTITANQYFTIKRTLGAGPPLPPCLPNGSDEACNLVEGVPALPPCLPNGDSAACNPIEDMPALPPCLPNGDGKACGG